MVQLLVTAPVVALVVGLVLTVHFAVVPVVVVRNSCMRVVGVVGGLVVAMASTAARAVSDCRSVVVVVVAGGVVGGLVGPHATVLQLVVWKQMITT